MNRQQTESYAYGGAAEMKSLLVLALAAAAVSTDAVVWKSCGSGVMTPTSVSLSPDPAIAGKVINVNVPGTTGVMAKPLNYGPACDLHQSRAGSCNQNNNTACNARLIALACANGLC